MKVTFHDRAWDDLCHWIAEDRRIVKRINALLRDIARDPHTGIGKPEPLRENFSGYWSRRITDEHRLVYKVADDNTIVVVQARYHY